MSGEIKRIDSIKNMAVFKDFHWASAVRTESDLGIEVPEMKTVVWQIVSKIKEKDPDQYSALLQSIGVNEKPVEDAQTAVEAR